MTAHQVKNNEIVFITIHLLQEWQQVLITDDVVFRPRWAVETVREFCNHGNRRIILAKPSLVREPIRTISCRTSDIDDGQRIGKFFVVVLAALRQYLRQRDGCLIVAGVRVWEEIASFSIMEDIHGVSSYGYSAWYAFM